MKSKLGGLSTILFFVGIMLYGLVLLGFDKFLIGAVIVSAVGIIMASFAEKGVYKKVGGFGNGIILVITIVIPFIVTTFFWNEP